MAIGFAHENDSTDATSMSSWRDKETYSHIPTIKNLSSTKNMIKL